MTIVPDDKNWTWVLERPCDECGFDSSTFTREEVGSLLRANIAEWQSILTATLTLAPSGPGLDPTSGRPSSTAATSATCAASTATAST